MHGEDAGDRTRSTMEPVASGCSDDTLDREVRRDAWECVYRTRSDLLVVSPPAGPWSPMQRFSNPVEIARNVAAESCAEGARERIGRRDLKLVRDRVRESLIWSVWQA